MTWKKQTNNIGVKAPCFQQHSGRVGKNFKCIQLPDYNQINPQVGQYKKLTTFLFNRTNNITIKNRDRIK